MTALPFIRENNRRAETAREYLHAVQQLKARQKALRGEIVQFLVESFGMDQKDALEKNAEVFLEGVMFGAGLSYVEERP